LASRTIVTVVRLLLLTVWIPLVSTEYMVLLAYVGLVEMESEGHGPRGSAEMRTLSEGIYSRGNGVRRDSLVDRKTPELESPGLWKKPAVWLGVFRPYLVPDQGSA
jgi:hypothetical protein